MAAPQIKYGIGNAASTTLSSSVDDNDTAFPLTSDTNFAAKSGEGMALMDEGEATEELGYATGKSGASLTIPVANRGLEGGSAVGHSSGASVKGVLTVGMWNDLVDAVLNILVQATGAIKAGLSFTTPTLITPIVKTVYDCGTVGATETVSWANGDRQKMTLDENLTITFSNAAEGQTLTLYMLQDGSGTNTITWADTIVWQDGITWGTDYYTTTANKWNVVVISYIGSAYLGMVSKFA